MGLWNILLIDSVANTITSIIIIKWLPPINHIHHFYKLSSTSKTNVVYSSQCRIGHHLPLTTKTFLGIRQDNQGPHDRTEKTCETNEQENEWEISGNIITMTQHPSCAHSSMMWTCGSTVPKTSCTQIKQAGSCMCLARLTNTKWHYPKVTEITLTVSQCRIGQQLKWSRHISSTMEKT